MPDTTFAPDDHDTFIRVPAMLLAAVCDALTHHSPHRRAKKLAEYLVVCRGSVPPGSLRYMSDDAKVIRQELMAATPATWGPADLTVCDFKFAALAEARLRADPETETIAAVNAFDRFLTWAAPIVQDAIVAASLSTADREDEAWFIRYMNDAPLRKEGTYTFARVPTASPFNVALCRLVYDSVRETDGTVHVKE